MPENANIKAALENLWDVVNEEGFELTHYYGQQQPPEGSVEIVRTHRPGAWAITDVRVCAVPAREEDAKEAPLLRSRSAWMQGFGGPGYTAHLPRDFHHRSDVARCDWCGGPADRGVRNIGHPDIDPPMGWLTCCSKCETKLRGEHD